MKYIFGPVPSRRLGFSLGVDTIPFKICTLDCIYCQLGRTRCKTVKREEYIPSSKILAELEEVLRSSNERRIDYITLSGSGEPTLNSKIGEIIREIKKITSIPVVVITNGTLLTDRALREELISADVVIPSLDAATEETFERVNRAPLSLKISKIIEGMMKFRKMYEEELWLEVMLIEGVNESEEELTALKTATDKIKPDKIQLNTPRRPPCEDWVKVVSSERLSQIKEFFGDNCEIIAEFKGKVEKRCLRDVEDEILALISRRPVTSRDISSSLGLDVGEVIKYMENLKREKKISSKIHNGKTYFRIIEI